jgi:hypothetical protein
MNRSQAWNDNNRLLPLQTRIEAKDFEWKSNVSSMKYLF